VACWLMRVPLEQILGPAASSSDGSSPRARPVIRRGPSRRGLC